MRTRWTGWVSFVTALAVAVSLGCSREDDASSTEPAPIDATGQADGSAALPDVEPAPEPEPPPPPPEVPDVLLTDAHRATCLVVVDDPMPQADLADATGASRSLGELFGEKLTVVFLWTSGETTYSKMAATAALKDLQADVGGPYASKGVQVVGINVHDSAEVAGEHARQAETTFTSLIDPQGEYFLQVAKEMLPRIYLLDAGGKILWFDIEYSRATRRNLLQAIQVELGEI